MGRQPAVIIVARHGTRLDAADKQWHLTSPAPYDPPLTYGGWRQSHSLGAKIAHILQDRETRTPHPPTNVHKQSGPRSLALHSLNGEGRTSPTPRPRKHRVILHTSPFLRCIQTSIAIGAGIAEAQTALESTNAANTSVQHARASHPMHSGSPHIHAMNHLDSPQLSAISEPEEFEDGYAYTDKPKEEPTPMPLLRIDAFLGEWFSSGYYEDITHPPDSVMMIASAKAGLLRENQTVDQRGSANQGISPPGNFPGGWGGPVRERTQTLNDDDQGPLSRVADLNRTLPRLNRSTSHSSAGSLAHRSLHQAQTKFLDEKGSDVGSYMSPAPTYAISPLAPIPPGYVAYAKAACINVDYQWDSMRPPHEWGDGGQYGEEWSSMHKRFRRGLQQMLLWYGQVDSKAPAAINEDVAQGSNLNQDDEEDMDTVVVLVTHSAGCNALIGALTNQPVLLDAGMASLTLATRRPESVEMNVHSPEPQSPSNHRRRSSIDFGVSEQYDVKITASTEHLRNGSTTTSRRSTSASITQNHSRHRSTSLASTSSSTSTSDGMFSSKSDHTSTATNGLQRSATTAVSSSNGLWTKPVTSPSPGLWSSPTSEKPKASFESRPPFKDSLYSRTPPGTFEKPVSDSENGYKPLPLEQNSLSRNGLWATPLVSLPSDRDKGQKRRWTHSEHR